MLIGGKVQVPDARIIDVADLDPTIGVVEGTVLTGPCGLLGVRYPDLIINASARGPQRRDDPERNHIDA
jgi:hypothetical protein